MKYLFAWLLLTIRCAVGYRARSFFRLALTCCAVLALCVGCASVHPIVDAEHVSSALQHLDGSPRSMHVNENFFGAGARVFLWPGATLDVTENYALQVQPNGHHEVFDARFTQDLMPQP